MINLCENEAGIRETLKSWSWVFNNKFTFRVDWKWLETEEEVISDRGNWVSTGSIRIHDRFEDSQWASKSIGSEVSGEVAGKVKEEIKSWKTLSKCPANK